VFPRAKVGVDTDCANSRQAIKLKQTFLVELLK
jgi:hypothetical protein